MSKSEQSPAQLIGYFGLLRSNPSFRNVWLGEIASGFGDWFTLIATASLVEELTGSGAALGSLFAVRMIAPFLVSPFAGVLADRRSRKAIMIATDLVRAAVVLGFLLVRDADDAWLLYTLTILQLGLSGFFVPARTALLPDIVYRRDLGAANALSSATYAVMQTLGAAAGGLLAGVVGLYQTFLIDAASFVISAVLISRVTAEPPEVREPLSVKSSVQQYMDGLRYLGGDVESLMISIQKGLNAFFITGGLNVLSISLAIRYFPLGEGGSTSVGLMFCATGLGTALGPILARRFTGDREAALRRGLFYCYLISAVGLLLIAPALSLAWVLAGMVVRGLGGGMMFVFSTHLLMMRVPADVRGRVFATEFAIRTLLGAAGAAVFSLGIDSPAGLGGMMWIATAAALVPALVWGFWMMASTPKPLPTEQIP